MEFGLTPMMLTKLFNTDKAMVSRASRELEIIPIVNKHKGKRYDIHSCYQIMDKLNKLKKNDIKNKINVFYNFKGGVGKTSISYQLGAFLAYRGYKILFIDLDPQAHLTSMFPIDNDEPHMTMYDVLINNEKIEQAIIDIPELSAGLIPSNLELTLIELPLSQKTRREEKLKKALDSMSEEYDYIFIDTNPSISVLNQNALFASDNINVVCETSPFSLKGLHTVVSQLEDIFEQLDKPLNISIIANKYEVRTATSQEVLGVLKDEYGSILMNSVIGKNEELNISTKNCSPVICSTAPSSPAFQDIYALGEEFLYMTSEKKNKLKMPRATKRTKVKT